MMKKIVELLIDMDNVDFQGEVDIMSLVDKPAIGIDWMAFADEMAYVDNKGMEKYKKFLDANVDMMKKPGGGPAGDGGVDHGEQMKVLEEHGIDTGYPFGYCFQIAQFVFYALGGYESDWELKCIKKMEYKVGGQDFQSTHWYVQNKENFRIVDLSAEQFDGILDINEYYPDGRKANLGFPYYNVDDKKVEFENTVPSLQTLKLYAKWREDHGKIDTLEEYYVASKFEELRKDFEECEECFDLENACWPGYEAIGVKKLNGKTVPNCVKIENEEEFASFDDYPESVKDNAARGIRLNEAVDNACATQVGKVRAQQLANGEPVSEETVRRMVSYLSRAKTYYNPSDEEACGTISYLLWGGEEALKWAERKVQELDKSDEELSLEDKLVEIADQYGEEYDLEHDILVDMTKEEFTTLEEIGKAASTLDILRKYVKKDEPAEQRYRYAGPRDGNTRGLCRKLLSMNKLYTIQDLRAMSSVLSRFGATRQGRAYSVFRFKGGKNCRHAWHSVKLVNNSGKTIMMDMGPVRQGNTSDRLTAAEARDAGQVAGPGNNWWGMSEQTFQVISEDQQVIIGPAMTPQKLIPRRDEEGNIFYVYFSKETIKKIAAQWMAKGYLHNTDVNHDMNVTQENTLLESWIVEDPETDKSAKLGYDLPKGTWMVSYKINNKDTWNKIKNGELNGYSIAGTFIEKLAR